MVMKMMTNDAVEVHFGLRQTDGAADHVFVIIFVFFVWLLLFLFVFREVGMREGGGRGGGGGSFFFFT